MHHGDTEFSVTLHHYPPDTGSLIATMDEWHSSYQAAGSSCFTALIWVYLEGVWFESQSAHLSVVAAYFLIFLSSLRQMLG